MDQEEKMGLEEKFDFLGKNAVINQDDNVVITIEQFIGIIKSVYASNKEIRKVGVVLYDQEILGMTFRDYGHLTKDLTQKVGEIDVSPIGHSKTYSHLFPEKSELYRTEIREDVHRIIDVPIDTLFELTLKSFRANNHVYSVRVELDDANKIVQMIYDNIVQRWHKTPEGSQQIQRTGTIRADGQIFRY